MMNVTLGVLSVEVVGAFFLLILFAAIGHRLFLMELLPLSFFIGAGFVAYQLLVYSFFGLAFNSKILIFPSLALFLAAFVYYGTKPIRLYKIIPEEGPKVGWNRIEFFLIAGILVQFLWILFLVVPMPVYSHDAVANYALKAKIFHFSGSLPEGFFRWSEATVAHPDYPLLLPFLMTWIYAFSGFNDIAVNIIMPVIYAAFLTLFYFQMRKVFNRPFSLLMIFLLGTVPQVADYATVIHADLILTALVTCAFAYFIMYGRGMRRNYLVLSSLLFGFSLWAKNEAIVFAGAFAAVFVFFLIRSKPFDRRQIASDMAVSFLIISVIAAPWFAAKVLSGVKNSDMDFSVLTPARFLQNVKDIPVLLNLFQQEVFGPKKWNIFWVIFFAAMIWKRKLLFREEVFYVTLFIVIAAFGYFAGYMCTTGNNLYFYVNTTISRFMLHFAGIATLLLAFLLAEDIRALKGFKLRIKH